MDLLFKRQIAFLIVTLNNSMGPINEQLMLCSIKPLEING